MKDNRAPLDQSPCTSPILMFPDTARAMPPDWSTVQSALVAEVLRRNDNRPRVRLRVYGESMLPALWPGDVVEIEACSFGELRAGEIVLAEREGRLFLHRLIADRRPDGFVLRGDCMRSADPGYPADALLGRLMAGTRERRDVTEGGRQVRLTAGWLGAKCSRAVGMLFWYCGLVRRLALKLHRRRMEKARDLSTQKHNGVATIELKSGEIGSTEAGAC